MITCEREVVGWFYVLLFSTFLIVPSGVSAFSGQGESSLSSKGTTTALQPVLSGLSSPVLVTNAKDGSNRLFIVELGGVVKVLQPGSITPMVFLDISSRIIAGGEQGLLGLAFHPQYESNRRFFVNYTRKADGATVIAEYRASVGNPNVADLTEIHILTIPQPFTNHNGGMIEFGPDGFLYIGMGDGGSGNDPGNRAQNKDDLLGKMLRINIDIPNGAAAYSSPADNPFFGPTSGRDEIYAVGFRNPFRWSFDRGTGRLFVGDVGQSAREEIDIVTLGGNYGWRVFEGTLCTNLDPLCGSGGFTPPIAEYDHSNARCSVTGGYVYRGSQSTLPLGSYVFADFCTGEIFILDHGVQTVLLGTSEFISSFGEDESGEIYMVGFTGSVYKLVNIDTRTGSLSAAPNPIQVCDGSGFGRTTLSWSSTETSVVEVRVGSPDGLLFTRGNASGGATTGKWVGEGTQFFLQDVSGGRPLTSVNTIATVTVGLTTAGCDGRTGSITANPNPIQVCDGSGYGATTLSWQSTGTTTVQVRVGSPSGALFTHAGPTGSATTGPWVGHGTQFFLQDVSGGLPPTPANTLATVTVSLTTNGCSGRTGNIAANPNPIPVCDGSGFGVTQLSWSSTATTTVQVRVGSPTGALFAHTGPNGSGGTGKWVGQGTQFFLQDVSGGLPLTPANTLSIVTVGLTSSGCTN